jgi:phospholipase C
VEDPRVEIQFEYARRGNAPAGNAELRVYNGAERALTVRVRDHGYKSGDHAAVIEPGGSGAIAMALGQSYWWYDFSVTIAGAEGFLRRFAGRVETGKSGFSDPVMGRVRL